MAQIYIPGNAAPNDVIAGKVFSAGTNYQAAGTLAEQGNYTYAESTGQVSTELYVRIPFGAYRTPTGSGRPEIIVHDNNFTAANIRSGVSIFGIAGSYKGPVAQGIATVSSSTASFTTASGVTTRYYVEVSGLSFQPQLILVAGDNSSKGNVTRYDLVTLYSGSGIYSNAFGGSVYLVDILSTYFVDGTSTYSDTTTYLFSTKNNNAAYVNSTGFRLPIAYNSSVVSGISIPWYAIGSVF
jgi:hypothetical protein